MAYNASSSDYFGANYYWRSLSQPFRDMGKDLVDTVKPYKSGFYAQRDALQFNTGLINLAVGVAYGISTFFLCSILAVLFIPCVIGLFYSLFFDRKSLKENVGTFLSFMGLIGSQAALAIGWSLRGLTQSLFFFASPFRIALRYGITWASYGYMNYQPFEDNSDIKELIAETRQLCATDSNATFKDNQTIFFPKNIIRRHVQVEHPENIHDPSSAQILKNIVILSNKYSKYVEERGQNIAEEYNKYGPLFEVVKDDAMAKLDLYTFSKTALAEIQAENNKIFSH